MEEGSKEKTAFGTHLGHFEYEMMPFGLTGKPSTFQAMIEVILKSCIPDFASVFLDNVTIYSATLEKHRGALMDCPEPNQGSRVEAQLKKMLSVSTQGECAGVCRQQG